MDKFKVAVVTGANSGIGAAVLSKLSKAGLTTVGLDINLDNIEKMKATTSGKIFSHHCDVTNDESVTKAFQWIESNVGSINVLINNAGLAKNVLLLDDNEGAYEELKKVIEVNLTGVVRCTRAAFKSMAKSGGYGYIINLNSVWGHFIPFFPNKNNMYPATKHAITAITEVLRQELIIKKLDKIRVSCISPGHVNTNIFKSANSSSALLKHLEKDPKLQPEDIADVVHFLLSTPPHVNVTEMIVRPIGSKL